MLRENYTTGNCKHENMAFPEDFLLVELEGIGVMGSEEACWEICKVQTQMWEKTTKKAFDP